MDSSADQNTLVVNGTITGATRAMLIVSSGDTLILSNGGSHTNLRLFAVGTGAFDVAGSTTFAAGSWVYVDGKLNTGRSTSSMAINGNAVFRITEACRLLTGILSFNSLAVGGAMSIQATPTTRWPIAIDSLSVSGYLETLQPADMDITAISNSPAMPPISVERLIRRTVRATMATMATPSSATLNRQPKPL